MKTKTKNYYFAGIAAMLLFTRLGLGTLFTSASDITPESISAGVNNERTTRNLTSLDYNANLAAAAAYKAQDMVNRSYFAHQDPNGNYIWGTDVADGYTPYTILGENLAINFPDTNSLMSAWMDSPEHRANILNPAFQDQGAGVSAGNVNAGQYSISIANEFGALAVVQRAPAPTPTPAVATAVATAVPKPTPVPKLVPTPVPTAVPAQVPTPLPTQSPAQIQPPAQQQPAQTLQPMLSITGDVQSGNGSTVTLSGTAAPNSSITISDVAFPNVGHATVTAGAAGDFAHEFAQLENGDHTFVAVLADGSATSAPYSVEVATASPPAVQAAATVALNVPAVDASSIKLTAFGLATATALDVSVNVSGNVQGVSASVNGQSSSLVKSSGTGATAAATSTLYSGTVLLPEHVSLSGQTITLTATGPGGKTASATAPLSSVPLTQVPGSSSLSNADLYGVFKGIAIVFGLIFAIFLIGDLIHSIKNRALTAADIISSSHIVVLLIAVGSMILVSWWH